MSKRKHKKSSCKLSTNEKVLLATAITNLLAQLVDLINKLIN